MVRASINAYGQLMDALLSDEIISYYQTLLQKEIFFDQDTNETEEEIDQIFEEYQKENDDINYNFSKGININKDTWGYVREKLSEYGL